jgi:Tfp pilus assembly PilM family ATPase
MATQTAIDYSSTCLRLMEFEGAGKRLRVLGVEEVDLRVQTTGEDDLEADDLRADAIATAMKERGFTSDPCGMAYDASSALFREFDLPFTNDDQVNKVVRFEAESHIPLDIDDVIMQHLVLRKSRDRSRILVAAVKKEDLLDRLDILDGANLDPMFVDVDSFALLHALTATGVAAEHAVSVVVHAQDASTNLMFLVDGQLYSVRSLRLGTHGLHASSDAALAEDQEVEAARTHDYLSRLKREIRRTLTTLSGFEGLEAVHASGSGSRIPGFLGAVSEAFGVDAQPLDLLSYVDHKLSEEDAERYGPDIGVALGLAYKLNGLNITETDFRRDECAYTRKFDQVKSPLIVMSFMLFLVVALGCIDAISRVRKVEDEYSHLLSSAQLNLEELMEDNDAARAVWERAEFGPARVTAVTLAVDQLKEDVARQLGRSAYIPEQHSALHAWIELSKLVKANEKGLGRLDLKSLDISVSSRNPYISFSGIMESASKYSDLLEMLADDPLYTEIDEGAASPTPNGMTSFGETTVTLDLDVLEARKEASST